jgi:hypothetical protein
MCCYICQITKRCIHRPQHFIVIILFTFHSWQFIKFVENNDLGVATEAARRAVKSAQEILKWSEIQGSEIESWLKGEDKKAPKKAQATPLTTARTTGSTRAPTTPKKPTTQGTSSLSLSPAVCITLFLSCLYQMLTTVKVQ